jgi:drug/metabolite transporter (DMT)-like permease
VDEKYLAPDIGPARQARALLIGTTVLWGLSFPLLRGLQLAQHEAAPEVPESLLACANMAMRFGVAALLLLPFYGRNLFRVTGREWSQATGLALFASAGLYLQTLGLAWTPPFPPFSPNSTP